MADYSPPTENLPIFDSAVFKSGDSTLTQSQGDKRYLRYPNAQGTENLQAINVNGASQFNATSTYSSTSNIVQTSGSTLQQQPASQYGSLPSGTTASLNKTFIGTNFGSTNTTSLQITDTSQNRSIICLPNSSTSAYNPLVQAQDASIISVNNSLTLTRSQGTTTGLRISSSNNIVVMGSGGTSSTPTNNLTVNGSTNTMTTTGTDLTIGNTNVNFSSTVPPTSSATQPSASDSSSKIPTTAWVQSAISAGGSTNITPNSINITPTSTALQYTSGISNQYNSGAFYALSGQTTQLYTNTTSPVQYTPNRPIQIRFTTSDGTNNFNLSVPITFTLNCFFYDGSSYGETSCQLMIFPSALTSNWGSYGDTNYNINNNINGNTGFYSTGRQYWTSNQQLSGFSGSQGWLQGVNNATGVYTIYIYFTMWTGSQWTYWIRSQATNGATSASPQMGIQIFS